MTLHELRTLLDIYPEDAEVLVSLFRANGTEQTFQIDGVDEISGIIYIEMSEEEGLIY